MAETKKFSLDTVKAEVLSARDYVFEYDGVEYSPQTLDKDRTDRFLALQASLKDKGDESFSPHDVFAEQLEILIGFPKDITKTLDIVLVRAFVEEVVERSKAMGEWKLTSEDSKDSSSPSPSSPS